MCVLMIMYRIHSSSHVRQCVKLLLGVRKWAVHRAVCYCVVLNERVDGNGVRRCYSGCASVVCVCISD